jgi:hypothetical protein
MSTQPSTASNSPEDREADRACLQQTVSQQVDLVLRALKRKSGVSVDELCKLTGWQAHSVRGFLLRTVRTKLGHEVVRQTDAKGVTRYSISKSGAAS